MTGYTVKWFGSRALLIEAGSLEAARALHASLVAAPLYGQLDVVLATHTLVIICDSHYSLLEAKRQLADVEPAALTHAAGRLIEVEVIYDGADLANVATQTGLDIEGVIAAHTGQTWQAAFSGFAPGFVYLLADNDSLDVPRRASPRVSVPAGSVALAGHFSAVYPQASPGGWQLIGRTNAVLWDLERAEPALIKAGDRVRYVAVDTFSDPSHQKRKSASTPPPAEAGAIEVLATGMQALIEDLGRPGLSHLGVPVSGVADEPAARQANRLVGNDTRAALIEALLGGLIIKARKDCVLARSGALGQALIRGPNGDRAAPLAAPFVLHAGETLALATPDYGLRSYLAVAGGLAVEPVLNSRASDVLSGIESQALAPGQILPVGETARLQPVGAKEPATLKAPPEGGTRLRVIMGPNDDWFDEAAVARLLNERWQVTPASNRIGLRLELLDIDASVGLERRRCGEMDTEGMVPGALQVPPSGMPVLFLKDHAVTGGYPVIATLVAEDLSLAAQLPPESIIRFVAVSATTLQPIASGASARHCY